MKKSEKLLDIIGQIDDRLIEDAQKAGAARDGKVESFDKLSRKKAKKKNLYRWQGALAACAVLAVCIGMAGLLKRSGMLLSPFHEEKNAVEAVPMEAELFAQDEAVPEAAMEASAEEVPEAAEEIEEAGEAEDAAADKEQGTAKAGNIPEEAAEIEQNAPEKGDEEAQEAKLTGVQQAAVPYDAGQETQGSETVAAAGYLPAQEDGQMQETAGESEKAGRTAEDKSTDTAGKAAAADENGLIIRVTDSSAKTISYTVENTGDTVITYGPYCVLERFSGKSWEAVEVKAEIAFDDLLYLVQAGKSREETLNLEAVYGALDSGSYRLVKEYQVGEAKDKNYRMEISFTVNP